MRRLWITRQKAAAGSAAKMKVYIEDPENGDTFIQDTLCRKLGELKNNQQKHFVIGEDAAKVYVVGDKLSRNLFCDFVTISEGREDVFLSGRNYLNPFAGNPFRFDGAVDQQTQENRKQVRKRGRGVLIAAVVLAVLVGIGSGVGVSSMLLADIPVEEAQVYSCQGMQIALGEQFEQRNAPGYTASYVNDKTVVRILREDFSLQEGLESLTLKAYQERIFANNGFDESLLREQEEDRIAFSYTWQDPNTGGRYAFYNVLMKGPDAFWMVQFSSPQEDANAREAVFRLWAGSIVFSAE